MEPIAFAAVAIFSTGLSLAISRVLLWIVFSLMTRPIGRTAVVAAATSREFAYRQDTFPYAAPTA